MSFFKENKVEHHEIGKRVYNNGYIRHSQYATLQHGVYRGKTRIETEIGKLVGSRRRGEKILFFPDLDFNDFPERRRFKFNDDYNKLFTLSSLPLGTRLSEIIERYKKVVRMLYGPNAMSLIEEDESKFDQNDENNNDSHGLINSPNSPDSKEEKSPSNDSSNSSASSPSNSLDSESSVGAENAENQVPGLKNAADRSEVQADVTEATNESGGVFMRQIILPIGILMQDEVVHHDVGVKDRTDATTLLIIHYNINLRASLEFFKFGGVDGELGRLVFDCARMPYHNAAIASISDLYLQQGNLSSDFGSVCCEHRNFGLFDLSGAHGREELLTQFAQERLHSTELLVYLVLLVEKARIEFGQFDWPVFHAVQKYGTYIIKDIYDYAEDAYQTCHKMSDYFVYLEGKGKTKCPGGKVSSDGTDCIVKTAELVSRRVMDAFEEVKNAHEKLLKFLEKERIKEANKSRENASCRATDLLHQRMDNLRRRKVYYRSLGLDDFTMRYTLSGKDVKKLCLDCKRQCISNEEAAFLRYCNNPVVESLKYSREMAKKKEQVRQDRQAQYEADQQEYFDKHRKVPQSGESGQVQNTRGDTVSTSIDVEKVGGRFTAIPVDETDTAGAGK